jgi:hypothetical protein
MTVRVRVMWDDKLVPPECCGNKMTKTDWEAQPIADQVKVTWKCETCGVVVQCFASAWDVRSEVRA